MLPIPRGMRSKTKNPYQSPPFDPNPPMMGTMGGDGTGEYPLGTGGPRVDSSDPNYVPPGTAGIKPLPPTKQPPMMPSPIPPMGGSDDLFGDLGAGSYDNLMSRASQEYSSGQSPYAGATDFLMNRSVFDRGVRPETSMPSTDMPSYGYSDAGGSGSLAAMQAQQPGIQAQYDQFAQQIQSAQEAAQQQAQQQTDMASSERQALMDRIAALEGQEGPDLDAFGAQLRQDILGQMPEQIDTEALRREITGEVLALAQQDFPDVSQIRDEVMRLLPEQEQVDVENLRRQIQESIDAGSPPEQIDALRQELQNRIRPVEERVGQIRESVGQLRGRFDQLPEGGSAIDIEDLRRRVQEGIDTRRPDVGDLERQIADRLEGRFGREPDLSGIREQIGELRGRLGSMAPGETFDPSQLQTQIAALQDRGLPPEVLERLRAVESREGPDEAAIAERVRSGINPRIADLRGQLESSFGSLREQSERIRSEQDRLESEASARASTRAAELAGLREQQQAQQSASQRAIQEVGGRIDPLQERLAALRERQGEATEGRRAIEERLGGRLGDVEGQVNPLAERISQLRGRLDERPQLTSEAVQRMIKESMGNRTTAGIKPAQQPSPQPKSAVFPPGYRGRTR